MKHIDILFINQASQSHIGLGHTTLVPNKRNYSLIITIEIINLYIKALDIGRSKRRVKKCSISCSFLLLES